ncbi:hypothetical protein VU12_10180, partial [Desulfobulbus sp. US4]|nr:hypothetical protein [Desulfobulbus sp. US4]
KKSIAPQSVNSKSSSAPKSRNSTRPKNIITSRHKTTTQYQAINKTSGSQQPSFYAARRLKIEPKKNSAYPPYLMKNNCIYG